MNVGSAFATATTGMLRNARSVEQSADRIVQGNVARDTIAQTPETGNVPSLTSEIVNLKQAEIGYAANASIIRTADQMSATLLDILA